MSDSYNSDDDESEASIPSDSDADDDDDYSEFVVAATKKKKPTASPKTKRGISTTTAGNANKPVPSKKGIVHVDDEDISRLPQSSPTRKKAITPIKKESMATTSLRGKSSTATKKKRPRNETNIHQSDGYDIFIPQQAMFNSVPMTTDASKSDYYPNEFSLLIQIDSSNKTTTTESDHPKKKKSGTSAVPTTDPYPSQPMMMITSGSVIGRIEMIPNTSTIKFDYHGTEYIGQIYPGPTAMVLSLQQQHSSGDGGVNNDDPSSVLNENKDSAELPVTASATATTPTTDDSSCARQQSSCVLVVDHIMNEFCNMIIPTGTTTTLTSNPATLSDGVSLNNGTNLGTTGVSSSSSINNSNVDYFQYSDDIYDVNKSTTTITTNRKRYDDEQQEQDDDHQPTKKRKATTNRSPVGKSINPATISSSSRKQPKRSSLRK